MFLAQASTFAEMLRHPRGTRDRVVAFQTRQLRRLVAHTYDKVPYYRELFDRAGVKPGDIRTLADLTHLPITSKRDLCDGPLERILARGTAPHQLIVRRTSGFSGEPFNIRRTWLEERLLGMLRRRSRQSFGIQPRDHQVVVGLTRTAQARDSQFPLNVFQWGGFYRETRLDCRQPPEAILKAMERLQPDVLSGLAGSVARLAQSISPGQRTSIRPRLVTTGGEVLTASMRARIRDAFQAPVFDSYGSHEFNLLAWQCGDSGQYHVCDDGLILEVVRDGRPAAPGERGEVVGTALHSFAMPFLRYRLGDIVTQGSDTCPCGQPFSTISAIHGRMIDYFRLPNGRFLHPYEISTTVILTFDWVQQYRLIQEREDRIVAKIVASTSVSPNQVQSLRDRIGHVVGPAVDVEVMLLDEIPIDPNGKFRLSRSFVQSEYDAFDWERADPNAEQEDETRRGRETSLPAAGRRR